MKALLENPGFWIVMLVLLIVFWGGPKLPGAAKSLGEAMRIFRKEVKTMNDERAADKKDKNEAPSEQKDKGDTPSDK